MGGKQAQILIPQIAAAYRSPRFRLSTSPLRPSLVNINVNGIRRKPMGSRQRNPLDYSMKMLQQQQKSALQFRTQAMQTQQRLRNLEQLRQRNQHLLDSMRQQRQFQQQQQRNWIEEGIRMRALEVQQRQQRLMAQLRQPISTPEPFKPPMRYEPPSFEPSGTPSWRQSIPPPGWGGEF